MTAPASASMPEDARTPAYSWVVLAMLCVIYTFNFLDRQLISILTEPIRKELGLSDLQMGLLGGIYFAAFYTIIGVIVGALADRTSRVRILFIGSFLWSLFTIACGMAKTYPMLMAARMGVGVGEAAGAPPSYSIISDYFPARRRGMALGLFSLGVPFGMALGAGLGAKIAELYGWRSAFIFIGAAGIVASFFLLLIVREPRRGAQEPVSSEPPTSTVQPSFLSTVKMFFSRPTLLFTALACGATAFVGYGVLNWTAPFLTRVKGINMGEIALYYSLMLAICMGAGTFLSGQLADWLSRRAKHWYALVPMIALIAAVPFYIGFVWAPTWQISMAFLAVPTLLNNAYLAPALAVVQNSVRPEQRTTSGALLLMVLNLIGLGLGPTFVGGMSTALTPEQGEVIALQLAMYALAPFYAVAIFFLILEAGALRREEKRALETA